MEVTTGLAESNGSLLPGLWRDSLHVICGLTACTPGSAPGPTLGNEYGKLLPGPWQQTCRSGGQMGQTDSRTQDSFIDPAPHYYAASANKMPVTQPRTWLSAVCTAPCPPCLALPVHTYILLLHPLNDLFYRTTWEAGTHTHTPV